MSVNYNNWALSLRQKLIFVCSVFMIGMIVGILFFDRPIIGIAIGVLGLFTFPKYKSQLIKNRKALLLLQFRDMLYSIASSVSAGRSMTKALEEAKTFCSGTYDTEDDIILELEYMTSRMEKTKETDIAVLRDFAKRSDLAEISDFVRVYESCKTTGGNLVKAISVATNIISDEINLGAELKSIMTQKLFEGRIVALAPFAMVFMLRMIAPGYLKPMWESTQGMGIMTFAVGLIGLGVWMIEKINDVKI